MKSRIDQNLFELREFFQVRGIQSVDLRLRLCQRSARLQAADVIPVVIVILPLFLGCERERYPVAGFGINEKKAAGHDTDHGEGPAIESKFAAKHSSVARVELLPECVTEYHFLLSANLAFVVGKSAAQSGSDAQEPE